MNSPLDQYIRQLHQSLRFVPARWRDEQVTEARQHLTARVDELTSIGMTPLEAEEEAVRHFGTATQTARTLMIAWWRQFLPLDNASHRPAVVAGSGYILVGLMLHLLANPLSQGLQSLGPYAFGATFPVVFTTISLSSLFLVGIVAGQRSGRRAVVGTFWGGWAASIIGVIAGRIYNAIQMNDPVVRQQYEEMMARYASGDHISVTIIPPYVLPLQILYCLATLCLGAYLGMRRHQPIHAVV